MSKLRSLSLIAALLVLAACSLQRLPTEGGDCKIQAYVDVNLQDYLSDGYHTNNPVRVAVVPFDVPESFAPWGVQSLHFGRQVASGLHRELLKTGEFGTVELFNRDRWPGKKAEFFAGNYGAITLAKNAGYDLVVLGYMEELMDDHTMVFFTKVIDVRNSVTLWYAKTVVNYWAREHRGNLSEFTKGLIKSRPEKFYLSERGELYSVCTAEAMVPPFEAGSE